jgi:hypothetical protein
MRKHLSAVCFAAALIPEMAWADYKKDYCGGVEYVGQDAGNKYPHLHCGKDFLAFSYSPNSHKNLAPNSIARDKKCNATNDLLANPTWNATNTTNPGAITAALQTFQGAGCD